MIYILWAQHLLRCDLLNIEGILPFAGRSGNGIRVFKESDFEWLSIHDLRQNDFFSTGMDAVHRTDPCHLFPGFQFFGDAFLRVSIRDWASHSTRARWSWSVPFRISALSVSGVCSFMYLSKMRRKTYREILNNLYPAFRKYDIPIPALHIKAMNTSWGSCAPARGVITLNKRLIEAPRQCIEYVIMHELCHLIHANHSKQFYAFLTMEMPDWKERKATLNQTVVY